MEPNGLVLRNLIYCGSQDPDIGRIGHTEKMLLMDFLGKRYSIFFYKYYTYYILYKHIIRELLYNNTYSTGTLSSNRKSISRYYMKKS